MQNLILASTSTVYGSSYLEYLIPTLKTFFKDVETLLFIPYARPSGMSYDNYTDVVSKALKSLNINVIGLHKFNNKKEALKKAEGVFVGGGNTFVLVNELYSEDLMATLKKTIENGTPYLGTSAGSNLAGLTMQTTNDMPIVYPPSYKCLECIPFNINAHYLDPDPNSKHKGETRETRIKEFHTYNDVPVIGLREGSWLKVNGDSISLQGNLSARWFEKDHKAIEIELGEHIYV